MVMHVDHIKNILLEVECGSVLPMCSDCFTLLGLLMFFRAMMSGCSGCLGCLGIGICCKLLWSTHHTTTWEHPLKRLPNSQTQLVAVDRLRCLVPLRCLMFKVLVFLRVVQVSMLFGLIRLFRFWVFTLFTLVNMPTGCHASRQPLPVHSEV